MFTSERISFILAAVVLSCILASGSDFKDDGQDEAYSRGQLWFGPRLGKRSPELYSKENKQAVFKLLEAADTLKFYYDQLLYIESRLANGPEDRGNEKMILTPKLERSLYPYEEKLYDNMKFTPRLGRQLLEEMTDNPTDQKIYGVEQTDSRTKYFSPRLGRTMTFSPRLGRELDYEMYPAKVRTARSTNKTQST